MSLQDKNILITPNIGSSTDDPKIVFSGADATTGAQNITLKAYPTSNGTLSFEGSAGQLFSITNSLTGTIYSVNDVSGIPSIEVLDTGLVKLAQYSGNVLLGTGTDNGTDKLQVNGTILSSGSVSAANGKFSGTLGVTGAATLANTLTVTGTATLANTLGVTGAATLNSTLGVTGAATLANTLTVTGAATLANTLTVTGTATFTDDLYVNGTYIYGDNKTIIMYSDAWLRLNPNNAFTSGIYAGTGILRTDGNLQVGNAGATLNVSDASFTYLSNSIWHAGNDGSGSGLDADLLDGKHGSDYLNLNTAVGGGIFGAPSKSAVGIFPSSSQGMVGFEYNMLHGALERYTVTQSGSAQISLSALFDGQLSPAYSGDGIDPANPWVLLLENLPSVHTQTGGVFGWTSRYWNPSSYKIEGYDVTSTPVWRTWIDTQASPVDSRDLILSLNNMGLAGNYTKIKITIYAAANGELGANGFKKFGLSEIFFHNPEAMRVYQYLDVDKLDGQHGSYYQNASNISTGTLILARGGTNAALTATAGAVAYSNSTSIALTAVGSFGHVLLSRGAATPTWISQAALSVGTANNVSGGTVTATSGTFSGTLGVTGAATFANTVGITGTLTTGDLNSTSGTFSSTLGVTGAATFANTVGITGTLTTGDLNSTSGTFSSTLGVTGAATFANTVDITGALTATSGRITKELEIGNTSIHANTQTISTASSNTIVDTFYTNEYSTSKYVIAYRSTSNTVVFGSTEILVMHNGSTVITSEYSTMYGTDIAFSVDAAIVGSNCNIYASANQGNLVVSTTRFSMV